MAPCRACGLGVALLALLSATSSAPTRVNSAALGHGELLMWHHRSLRATEEDVTSPDVALDGACAADIMQHCKHLLTRDIVTGTARTQAAGDQASSSVGQSAKVQLSTTATETATGKPQGAAADKVSKGAASQAQDPAATGSTGGAAGATQAQLAGGDAATAVLTAAAGNATDVAAGNATDVAAGNATDVAAGNATDVAAGNATDVAAGNATDVAAGNATDVAAGNATDVAAGNATGVASRDAVEAVGQTIDTAATGTNTTSGAATETGGAAAAASAAGAGAASSDAGVTAGSEGTSAAATQSTSTAATSSDSQGAQQQAQVLPQTVGQATLQDQTRSQGQAQAPDSAVSTTTAAAGAVGAGAVTADSDILGTTQQQQGQLQSHRRRLLAGEAGVVVAVRAEVHAAAAQKDELHKALQQLGLRSSLSAAVMSSASAPLARCLRGVMHASEMSISPHIPDVADECKAEVRSVFIKRASDVRYDPPLLASCAGDITAHCEYAGDDTTAVLGCLKLAKPRLQPLCRSVVTVRQAAAAEDLSLDPDLQRSCGAEREALCLEAGWGNGAAQMCLLGHLRGSLPQVFSELIFPATEEEEEAWGSSSAAAADKKAVELSSDCSAALVQRLIEEGEDVRFNYRLAAACAGDKQVFCRDVRPGGAAVLRCLEDHMDSPNMQEECRDVLTEVRQLRSLDVRLDHTFTANCATDVRNLCGEDTAAQLTAPPDEVEFGLSAPFECLRGRLDMVRDDTCRRHMYESVIAAFTDNRLDADLMRSCHPEIAVLCSQHPARALECLQEKIDKFSRDDSPAVLKGKVSDTCLALVLERKQQAATDVAFLPDLMAACAREHATFCSAPELEGVRALDCLADHRNSPDFSGRCGEALRDYLAEAARDIHTMAGLQKDCRQEIGTLCKGVQPGEGRVISCLRDQRANITGELCRRQVMRLLGLLVEDHRLDVKLTQACTSDVQKYCGGVEAGDGEVHDCLRRSFDHLSPECRAAEEEVEQLEHEDVRLNPKLMRECPLAASTFCADVPPGDAGVIRCLQANMDKGHFPPACRTVLQQLTDRATVKYSLNYRLRRECEEDAERLCPEAVDELGSSWNSLTGTGGAHSEETTLACLARQPTELGATCRAELQALVKLSLNRYRVGMPLTSQCDGDVMQRCQVDQVAAPFLQRGYVLSCLAKHAAQLHKPCWELVSTMDEGQFKRAAVAESSAWQSQLGGGAVVDEKVLKQVVADVRRELEPRLYSTVHDQVNRKAVVLAHNMTGTLVGSITPKVNALMHTTVSLLMLTGLGLLGALLAWRKFMMRGGSVLVVRKDGRV